MGNNKETDTKEFKLLKPKTDIVFQSLFNQTNEKITKNFVQALLGEKIEHIVINNDKELLRAYPNDKLGILDLQLDVNENEKVDVEIQLIEHKNFAERLLFYFSKLYQSSIKRGNNYITAKRVVLIAIIDYELDIAKELEGIETIWQLREKSHPKIVLTSLIEIHIIELEKVRKIYKKNKYDEKVQWLLFLDDPNSREAQEIMENNKNIKEATVVVKQMSEDEKIRRLADLREKAILDEKSIYAGGLDRGISLGEKKANIEMAKKLLKKGMKIEDISEVSGLSIEEISVLDAN